MNVEIEYDTLRFVVLFHEYDAGDERDDHWDLMLEHEGALLTWALRSKPAPGKTIVAKTLPDHRIEYLELEGEISHNRGRVTRLMGGRYHWKLDTVKHIAILQTGSERWQVEFLPFDGDSVNVVISSL